MFGRVNNFASGFTLLDCDKLIFAPVISAPAFAIFKIMSLVLKSVTEEAARVESLLLLNQIMFEE